MRVGTWNLDARHQPAHVELLLGLACDVLLLTEVSPRLELPGYDKVLTSGTMARGQHWAGVFSRLPMQALPEPHPASATARVDGWAFCSSILPWRGCGAGEPWGSGAHAEKSARCLAELRTALDPESVWGGDWNHALVGPEWAGSKAGRAAIREVLQERELHRQPHVTSRSTTSMITWYRGPGPPPITASTVSRWSYASAASSLSAGRL